jgi:hypothetical protein
MLAAAAQFPTSNLWSDDNGGGSGGQAFAAKNFATLELRDRCGGCVSPTLRSTSFRWV